MAAKKVTTPAAAAVAAIAGTPPVAGADLTDQDIVIDGLDAGDTSTTTPPAAPPPAAAAPVAAGAAAPAADVAGANAETEAEAAVAAGDPVDSLYASFGDFGAALKTEADQAWQDFKKQLPNLQLADDEADDVRWAIHALTVAGISAIGARGTDAQRRLQQSVTDAKSILLDVAAVRAHDGWNLVGALITRVFDGAADIVLSKFTSTAASQLLRLI